MKKTRTLLLALSLGLGMNAYAADPDFSGVNATAAGAFSADGGNTWTPFFQQEQDTPYIFTPEAGQTGIIAFNPSAGNFTVNNDFQLNGTNFEIRTNANQTVAFAQPLSNYGTTVTLTGQGTMETKGAAAFGQIIVGNSQEGDAPTLKIDSQIGVINGISVAQGGTLDLDTGSTLLLTKQIANEGTVNIANGAIIDASNVDRKLAKDLGIQLLNNLGDADIHGDLDTVQNGYLYGGDDAAAIKIATGSGTVTSSGGTLRIGVVDFTIEETGLVHNTETQYSMWLQNSGEATLSLINDKRNAQGHGTEPLSVMLRGGSYTPTVKSTDLDVDFSFGAGHEVYVSRNAVATINLVDYIPEDPYTEEESIAGAIGMLKVLDGAKLFITTLVDPFSKTPPDIGRINAASFVGQNIELTSIALEGEVPFVGGPIPESHNFSPLALTVESASSVLMKADIQPAYGYFVGIPYPYTEERDKRDIADYLVKGILTMATGFTMDMTAAPEESSSTASFAKGDVNGSTLNNVVYSEEFAHLVIEEKAAVVLQEDAIFKANTVQDGAILVDIKDGEVVVNKNLDTTRTAASAAADGLQASYEAEPGYKINGTVTVKGLNGSSGQATSITAIDGAGHYTTRNYGYTIANAEISVTDDYVDYYESKTGDTSTTISNILIGDSVTNNKSNGHGTVTLDNVQSNNYDTLWAKEGDIAITNNPSVNAETVHIGADLEVSVSTLDTIARDGSLTVTTLLQADGNQQDGYSKIGADLHLASNATLNVAAADGIGGIDMQGNEVVFDIDYNDQSTALTLSTDDYRQAWAMKKGGKYDLFHNVSAFTMYSKSAAWSLPAEEDWELDASQFFSNLEEGCFYLCYSGADFAGGHGENVGTIYLYSLVPEPTTGTLSLLALAGLAARRRRK